MIILEPVLLATKVMTCQKEHASCQLLITQSQLILVAIIGIGTVKYAWLAPKIGSSIKMEYVFL